MDWHKYFMSMAYLVAMKSKDPSSKVGTVIVGPNYEVRATGYNGLPRGAKDVDSRNVRPDKYLYYVHSEQNSLLQAARAGVSVDGCHLYTLGTPCMDCAKAIIQAGIKEVFVHEAWDRGGYQAIPGSNWDKHIGKSAPFLLEAGVGFNVIEGPIVTEIVACKRGVDILR